MKKQTPSDRNFDSLIHKFEKRVYNTVKGEWRLKLVKEDLDHLYQQSKLNVWDAGCGFAQVSQWLAEAGHQVTLCDLSQKMLHQAEKSFSEADLQAEFLHGAAQDLAPELPDFDLVLFHAVLEWLATPLETLKTVADKVKPGGTLSLLFYNRNAFVYNNVLKGEWRWQYILDDAYIGKGKNLTPPNPQFPHDVISALQGWGFDIQMQTGIRVFHDYLTPQVLEKSDQDELFALEYQYCRMPTYRDMGRYIHLVAQKL
ncbi:methyltransferase domain-containing protein [Hydrogenovibrio kuenenii]|uniref:methyltransferase domain-containing protein n=1 Tax=Hydrogenovibrio kuenenii TaxID=63658 RepID=UPI000463031D|nr:methyltransferase domain-containing protein [Hydrogenovibrio kuenenii]